MMLFKKKIDDELSLQFSILDNNTGLSADDAKLLFGIDQATLEQAQCEKILDIDKSKTIYFMYPERISLIHKQYDPQKLYKITKGFFYSFQDAIVSILNDRYQKSGGKQFPDRPDYSDERIQMLYKHLHHAVWMFSNKGVNITVPLIWTSLTNWYVKTNSHTALLPTAIERAKRDWQFSDIRHTSYSNGFDHECQNFNTLAEAFQIAIGEVDALSIYGDYTSAMQGSIEIGKLVDKLDIAWDALKNAGASDELLTGYAYRLRTIRINYSVSMCSIFLRSGDNFKRNYYVDEANHAYQQALDTADMVINNLSLSLDNAIYQSEVLLFDIKATALEKLERTREAIDLGREIESFRRRNGQLGIVTDDATFANNDSIRKCKEAAKLHAYDPKGADALFNEALLDNARAVVMNQEAIADGDVGLKKRLAELYQERANLYDEYKQYGKAGEWYEAYVTEYEKLGLMPVIYGGDIPSFVMGMQRPMHDLRYTYLKAHEWSNEYSIPLSGAEYERQLLNLQVFLKAIKYVTHELYLLDMGELKPSKLSFTLDDNCILQTIFQVVNLIYLAWQNPGKHVEINDVDIDAIKSKELRKRLYTLSEILDHSESRSFYIQSLVNYE